MGEVNHSVVRTPSLLSGLGLVAFAAACATGTNQAPSRDDGEGTVVKASAKSDATEHADVARCVINDLLGGWTARDGSAWSIDLRNDRFTLAFDGRLNASYPIVRCDASTFTVCASGRRQLATPHLTGDELELEVEGSGGAIGGSFVRGSEANFRFEPMKLPEPVPLQATEVASIQVELERRGAEDQRVRTQQPPDFDSMLEIGRRNEAWLIETTAKVGWIDDARFGDAAARSAWLIAQHAMSLNFLAGVLAEIDMHADGQHYALMYDRLQTRQGKPQRYGSQLIIDKEGNKGLMPIEDLEGVDERRAKLGMPPLAEYLKFFDLDEPHVFSCSED